MIECWEGVVVTDADKSTEPGGPLQAALDQVEREMILQALVEARGNKAKAARALGLTERVMGLRVRKYGLDPRSFRARNEASGTVS